MMNQASMNLLQVDAAQALFEGRVQCLVVSIFENEKPPCGLSGLMDWYFHGAISHYLKRGALTGKMGECTYVPFTRQDSTYHLLLVGAGQSKTPGARISIPKPSLQVLHKNLTTLNIPRVCISRQDWGGESAEALNSQLKGISLWIAP